MKRFIEAYLIVADNSPPEEHSECEFFYEGLKEMEFETLDCDLEHSRFSKSLSNLFFSKIYLGLAVC